MLPLRQYRWQDPQQLELVYRLSAAIPEQFVEEYCSFVHERKPRPSGWNRRGVVYNCFYAEAGRAREIIVASYNNTRNDPQEILDWIERARYVQLEEPEDVT